MKFIVSKDDYFSEPSISIIEAPTVDEGLAKAFNLDLEAINSDLKDIGSDTLEGSSFITYLEEINGDGMPYTMVGQLVGKGSSLTLNPLIGYRS